ncbi:MAG: hypothetical protein H6Q14_501 [Bacteroidetes bacterium]|nr:hypothetical protein [Bacteroidota bacterium]
MNKDREFKIFFDSSTKYCISNQSPSNNIFLNEMTIQNYRAGHRKQVQLFLKVADIHHREQALVLAADGHAFHINRSD